MLQVWWQYARHRCGYARFFLICSSIMLMPKKPDYAKKNAGIMGQGLPEAGKKNGHVSTYSSQSWGSSWYQIFTPWVDIASDIREVVFFSFFLLEAACTHLPCVWKDTERIAITPLNNYWLADQGSPICCRFFVNCRKRRIRCESHMLFVRRKGIIFLVLAPTDCANFAQILKSDCLKNENIPSTLLS